VRFLGVDLLIFKLSRKKCNEYPFFLPSCYSFLTHIDDVNSPIILLTKDGAEKSTLSFRKLFPLIAQSHMTKR
jgi:hypothetical protein